MHHRLHVIDFLRQIMKRLLILLALVLSAVTIDCVTTYSQEYDIPLGYEPQRNTFWKIYSDIIGGDIANATVSDATKFANNRVGWMFSSLYDRTGDDDTIISNGIVNRATEPLNVDTLLALPPYQTGANNYNILNPGLNADQWDSHDWEELPSEVEQAAKLILVASDEITLSTGVGGRITIGVELPTPLGTPTPIILPTPLPTPTPINFVAGPNITIVTIEGGYVVSATIPDASLHLQVIGGDNTFTIDHGFNFQYPKIEFFFFDTGQKIHNVDVTCGDPDYATAEFSYILDTSSAIAVASVGSGGMGGSTVINVTQEYSYTPVPVPTMVLTGSGLATVTPIAGGYNIHVEDPAWPTPTDTPIQNTPTPTHTPTPPKYESELGDGVNTHYNYLTGFGGPAVVQGVINSSSQVIDLSYQNKSNDEIEIEFHSPVELNQIKVLAAKADEWQSFGDTGESSFTLDPGLDQFALCIIHQRGPEYWKYSPIEVRYTNNTTVGVHFNYSPGPLQANFLVAAGTQTIGNGSANSFLVTTGMDHSDLIVQVFETAGDRRQLWAVDVIHSVTGQLTVTFDRIPSANQYTVAWADTQFIPTDLDSEYWRLDGSNRLAGRGDQFNPEVNVWAKQLKADRKIDIITEGGIDIYDNGYVCGAFGYARNNYFKCLPDYYFSFQPGGSERLRITASSVQIYADTAITGNLTVSGDVTADTYYGDTADAGWGLDKTIDVYGRTIFSLETPTPTLTPTVTPTFTPTPTAIPVPPTPTFPGIRRTDDALENTGIEINFNEARLLDNSVVESTTFRFKVVTVATKAELLAFMHNGDFCCWMPGGNILARADLEIKYAEDTEEYFLCATYNENSGSLAGITERQQLVLFDNRDPEHTYLGAVRLDDQIYLIRVWNNG